MHGEGCYTHSISNAEIYSGLGSTLQLKNPFLDSEIKKKKSAEL